MDVLPSHVQPRAPPKFSDRSSAREIAIPIHFPDGDPSRLITTMHTVVLYSAASNANAAHHFLRIGSLDSFFNEQAMKP